MEYQIRINKKQVAFQIRTNLDLETVYVNTDKVKLKQILINLVSNAFKYTETGSIFMSCEIGKDNRLTFCVSDSGIGISADKHEMIFERFFQLQKNNSNFQGGNGLGLSIVKGLVGLLGGKIWVESVPGKGSSFFFTIDHGNYSLTPVSGFAKKSDFNDSKFPGKTILIVEDDYFNADLIQEYLTDKQSNLIFAMTGREAIRKAHEFLPDLILMDIGLPDMNGYEVIHHILEMQPGALIIAQTAYASADDRNKAFRNGCIDYISKPVKQEALTTMLGKYLHKEN